MAKVRKTVAAPQARPRNISEAAKRSQVLPRYMAMGYWTTREMRKTRR